MHAAVDRTARFLFLADQVDVGVDFIAGRWSTNNLCQKAFQEDTQSLRVRTAEPVTDKTFSLTDPFLLVTISVFFDGANDRHAFNGDVRSFFKVFIDDRFAAVDGFLCDTTDQLGQGITLFGYADLSS